MPRTPDDRGATVARGLIIVSSSSRRNRRLRRAIRRATTISSVISFGSPYWSLPVHCPLFSIHCQFIIHLLSHMCGACANHKGRTTSPPSMYIDPARSHRQPSSVAGAEGASGHAQAVSAILPGSCQGLAPLINFFFFRFTLNHTESLSILISQVRRCQSCRFNSCPYPM